MAVMDQTIDNNVFGQSTLNAQQIKIKSKSAGKHFSKMLR